MAVRVRVVKRKTQSVLHPDLWSPRGTDLQSAMSDLNAFFAKKNKKSKKKKFVLKTAKSGEKATGDDAETKKDEASATASMSALGIKKKTVTELTDAVVEEKPEFDRAAMEQEETANLLQSVMAKNKEKLVGRNCAHQGIFANPV